MATRHASDTLLAKRYASALFAVAEDQKNTAALLAEFSEQLAACAQAVAGHAVLSRTLRNPGLSQAELAGVAEGLANAVKAKKIFSQCMAVIAENRRLALLPAISKAFDALVATSEKRLKATVITAQPVAAKELVKLQALLSKVTEHTVEAETRIDTSVIGGVIVQMGSVMIDSSIKGKLDQLRHELKHADIA